MAKSFKEALREKDFVVMAELPLTPASSAETIVRDAESLKDHVDGFLLTDNQYGQPHLSPSYAAGVLLQNGHPPVLQISSRNRNRIALIGELLAARAAGIDSLMMVRGGVLPEGYTPRPKAVLDTDAKDLIATARIMNEDEGLDRQREFLIGAAGAVHDPQPDATPDELIAKADAGAQMIITQICLDADVLRRYMAYLVAQRLVQRFSVIVSIAVIDSVEIAEWLIANRLGTIVPDGRRPGGREQGIEQSAALVAECRSIPGVSGVNFAFSGSLDSITEVLARSGEIRHES